MTNISAETRAQKEPTCARLRDAMREATDGRLVERSFPQALVDKMSMVGYFFNRANKPQITINMAGKVGTNAADRQAMNFGFDVITAGYGQNTTEHYYLRDDGLYRKGTDGSGDVPIVESYGDEIADLLLTQETAINVSVITENT